MLQKDALRQDIETAINADAREEADPLLTEKRQLGLQFMIEARPDQSLDDVANIWRQLSDRFEVEPLLTSPPFPPPNPNNPAWTDTIFVATVYGVAFDDVSAHPWDIAHTLKTEGGFVSVVPEVPIANPEEPEYEQLDAAYSEGWEHEAMNIREAWDAIGKQGKEPGSGVSIGHPDTGWVEHEVFQIGENLDPSKGWNFVNNNGNPQDPLNYIGNPGHGTAVASLMVAPEENTTLQGVAPKATVIPIRTVRTVVLNGQGSRLVQAVKYAVCQGCQVISISLGGWPLSKEVKQAIQDAIDKNCIVIAASGNIVPYVVQPASYDNSICMAVGGIQPGDQEWNGASWKPRGKVAISAPAKSVLRAKADKSSPSQYQNTGAGTSFATAYLAGVAALWLSYHFDATKPQKAQQLFLKHVQDTARKPSSLDTDKYFGIVDAKQLIETPLPSEDDVLDREVSDFTALFEVAQLVGCESKEQMEPLIARTLLGRQKIVKGEESVALEAWASEITDILQRNPNLRMEIENKMTESITEEELRNFLIPAASDALKKQFDLANKT